MGVCVCLCNARTHIRTTHMRALRARYARVPLRFTLAPRQPTATPFPDLLQPAVVKKSGKMFGSVAEKHYLCTGLPHMGPLKTMTVREYQDMAGRILAQSRETSAQVNVVSCSIYLRLCTRTDALDKQKSLREVEGWAKDLKLAAEQINDMVMELRRLYASVEDHQEPFMINA